MLDFDPNRVAVAPRPAATIILLREPSAGSSDAPREVEVCVMQRSTKSSFMGGAVVFPGGRIEPHDSLAMWSGAVTTSPGTAAWWDDDGVAARIAACRESLEEVGLIPLASAARASGAPDEPLSVSAHSVATIRAAAARGPDAMREAVVAAGCILDLARLVPLSRWVTPEAESRRFDARFFLAPAPEGQEATSDDHEATRVYWATPSALLREFDAGTLTLFPPTHRTLELLVGRASVRDALALAEGGSLDVVCPRFAMDSGTPTLALPGDPLHEVSERRLGGSSRYVLRDARWVSEDPPSSGSSARPV